VAGLGELRGVAVSVSERVSEKGRCRSLSQRRGEEGSYLLTGLRGEVVKGAEGQAGPGPTPSRV
jgi:hypothetical protein